MEIDPLARPGGLICCSFSLVMVQGFLSGGWILLVPASIDPPSRFGGSWTCSAATSKEILSSLSYVGSLIFLTIIVSFKARRNHEARNILVCCIFLALEAATWTAAAHSESLVVLHRDCVTGVIAGLIGATLVLFTIFIPKLAQHSKIAKEKKIQQIQHATLRVQKKMQPVMYGLPHYSNTGSSSPRSVVIKAFPGI
jgi:7 transmembrane sweet-taste receptor of 3 GCPR